MVSQDKLTSMISFALFVDMAFNTRSTALAVAWFRNSSRIVAAVKSEVDVVIFRHTSQNTAVAHL